MYCAVCSSDASYNPPAWDGNHYCAGCCPPAPPAPTPAPGAKPWCNECGRDPHDESCEGLQKVLHSEGGYWAGGEWVTCDHLSGTYPDGSCVTCGYC